MHLAHAAKEVKQVTSFTSTFTSTFTITLTIYILIGRYIHTMAHTHTLTTRSLYHFHPVIHAMDY